MPESQARDDAGGDRDDVLEGPAELDAHEVVGRVEAERGGREPLWRPERPVAVVTRRRRRPTGRPARRLRRTWGPRAPRPSRSRELRQDELRHALAASRDRAPWTCRRAKRPWRDGLGSESSSSARRDAQGTQSKSVSTCASASRELRRHAHRAREPRCPADACGCRRSAAIASATPRRVPRARRRVRLGRTRSRAQCPTIRPRGSRASRFRPSFRSSPRASRLRFSRCLTTISAAAAAAPRRSAGARGRGRRRRAAAGTIASDRPQRDVARRRRRRPRRRPTQTSVGQGASTRKAADRRRDALASAEAVEDREDVARESPRARRRRATRGSAVTAPHQEHRGRALREVEKRRPQTPAPCRARARRWSPRRCPSPPAGCRARSAAARAARRTRSSRGGSATPTSAAAGGFTRAPRSRARRGSAPLAQIGVWTAPDGRSRLW